MSGENFVAVWLFLLVYTAQILCPSERPHPSSGPTPRPPQPPEANSHASRPYTRPLLPQQKELMGSSSPWLEIGRQKSVKDGQQNQCARFREIRLFRLPIGRMVSCVSMLQSNCCCKTIFLLEVKEMLVAAVIGIQARTLGRSGRRGRGRLCALVPQMAHGE